MAGWLADLGDEPRLVRGRNVHQFTAADALMYLIPLVRRAGLEELHDWLETALLVMSAARRRLQTLL